jgi:BlaI family penicillinase repressor
MRHSIITHMSRKPEHSFTKRELDVMSILWRRGSGTVAEVRDELPVELGYTSVLWVLQTLAEKGAVGHEQEGRAYRYHPLVGPEEAGTNALTRLLDKIFQGSAEMLLARLVAERDLSETELRRMRELLDQRLELSRASSEGTQPSGRAARGRSKGSSKARASTQADRDADGEGAEGPRSKKAHRRSNGPRSGEGGAK